MRCLRNRLIAFLSITLGSCTYYIAQDRLDSYVASSFRSQPNIRPQCVRVADHINGVWQRTSKCRLVSGQAPAGQGAPFFVLAVSAKDLRTPLGGKKVEMIAVDRDGVAIPEGIVTVTPAWVITNADGRNAEPILISASKPGEYRIQLTYVDRGRVVIGVSPPLHVLGHATEATH